MKSKYRLILATIITTPLFLSQVGLLMFCLKDLWEHSVLIYLWAVVAWPLIFAYYLLWTPAGMIYLLACLLVTLWAWGERDATWRTRLLLLLVSFVTALGIAWDIWWYASGQIVEQLA